MSAKVTLITHTPEPEKVIAAAAKLCYSAVGIEALQEKIDAKSAADFVLMLGELGHESPIEHVSFTFGIEGVSRALLAQITRHRIASYSVQSQRYVEKADFAYITPPEIEKDEVAAKEFQKAMDIAKESYNKITEILFHKHLDELMKSGIDEKKAKTAAKKQAIEDARFVLPNACDTRMIITMNARSLMNFFRHRCCNRAQWEIKDLADKMLDLVREAAPTLFSKAGPPCAAKPCPEGKMSCGKQAQMREKYRIKED